MAKITINGTQSQVPDDYTILDAARAIGVDIPTLCHLNLHDVAMVNQVSSCRVCVVEVEGRRTLVPSCTAQVQDGMVVKTNSPRAVKSRRAMVELLLSNHPKDCLVCERNVNCELQSIAARLGVREIRYQGRRNTYKKDTTSYSLVRNAEKCILCRRCETMCNNVQTVGVYSAVHRGFDAVIGTAFDLPMTQTCCTFCGQCVSVCPTGALTETDNSTEVWDALNDPEQFVVAQTAPAVRVALGESFGMPAGSRVTGKMVAALKNMGFDMVLDTDFGADLTIVEESTEFISRLKNGGRLPILTSCCPAWVKFIEHQFPELLDVPSTCKSPHEMLGALAKTYLADKIGVKPQKITMVSIMPCIAKKFEARREELAGHGVQDVDYVLSTRELSRMINEAGINFAHLPDMDFDQFMGESSGAGVIFGTTGGVIEAVARTVSAWMEGEPRRDVDFVQLRGFDGVREASVNIAGRDIKMAVAHGLGNARRLLEGIRDGKTHYHAIEIMACPGGCIGGGGQPYHANNPDILRKRAEAIYGEDRNKPVRLSHENSQLKALYREFLGEPGGDRAHQLLHTHYKKRNAL